MKLSTLTFLLILLVTALTTNACAQQLKPEDFANSFYQKYLELNVRGLPDEKQLKSLSPYLSEDLHKLFEKAQVEQKRFIEENPSDKPPWIDGDMFTSLFEGAQSFKVSEVKKRGIYTDVNVNLEYKDSTEPARWSDTLVLVRTREGWRIWDILLNGDWQLKTGDSLRHQLGVDN